MELGWRKTWEDKDEDYVCLDGEREIARIHWRVEVQNPNLKWAVFMWFRGGQDCSAPSRRQAMLMVEEAYEASIKERPA